MNYSVLKLLEHADERFRSVARVEITASRS